MEKAAKAQIHETLKQGGLCRKLYEGLKIAPIFRLEVFCPDCLVKIPIDPIDSINLGGKGKGERLG